MKALCWYGTDDVRVARVPDPTILNPRDAIVKVTLTAICGSDLHLLDGFIPTMKRGDILGHEFMGEVVDVGRENHKLKVGDRVVVPFTIACGRCFFCKRQLWSVCDNSNPNAWMAEKLYGYSPSGLFGYSHMIGGYAGGQAEYVRVPFADVGPLKVPAAAVRRAGAVPLRHLPDRLHGGGELQHPAGRHGRGVGLRPVGQFAIKSAWLLGAGRVIAIDREPERLRMAARSAARPRRSTTSDQDVFEALKDDDRRPRSRRLHRRRRPGSARHQRRLLLRQGEDRGVPRRPIALSALRQAIHCCRKGGTVSIPGVYGGFLDKVPLGAAFDKGLTLRMGQTHVQRYMPPLLDRIERGEIDPSFVITHRLRLDDAPGAYKMFRDKQDDCIKVVMKP